MTLDSRPSTLLNDIVLAHPFHRFCGLELISQEPGASVCRFPVDDNTANPAGVLHGGILYGMMDVCAFLALTPMLADSEQAVSHDVHCSVLRPVSKGKSVELRARVDRKGKSIAFIRVEAWVDDKLVGTGTITKSVLSRA